MIVVGVDGCKGGWVAARWDVDGHKFELSVHPHFSQLFQTFEESDSIAVDIPIGLVPGRQCDKDARRAISPRGSCVFTAPSYEVACSESRLSAHQLAKRLDQSGVSAQAFGIFPKIREVNEFLTPSLQSKVIEVHPEVCFWAMTGSPMRTKKSRRAGYDERRNVLEEVLGLELWERDSLPVGARGAKPDDVLDAIAAAWTARRWVNGSFGRFPGAEQRDDRGLRAQIVY